MHCSSQLSILFVFVVSYLASLPLTRANSGLTSSDEQWADAEWRNVDAFDELQPAHEPLQLPQMLQSSDQFGGQSNAFSVRSQLQPKSK